MSISVFLRSLFLILTSFTVSSSMFIHDFPGSCNYKLIQSDNSKDRRIIMDREVLVKYIPQELVNKGNYTQVLQIDIELEKTDNEYYITLFNRFYSKKAQLSYGLVTNNTKIKIDLINGEHLYLQHLGNSEFLKNAIGEVEFAAGFSLNKKDVKVLLKNEIESIGVFWTSGFESYEVFNIDVIRDQLTCIHKL